jgi:hypothetical protein
VIVVTDFILDDRTIEDGSQKLARTDTTGIGKYVVWFISNPQVRKKHIFPYIELLSMDRICDVMATMNKATPTKEYLYRSTSQVIYNLEAGSTRPSVNYCLGIKKC